MTLSARVDGLDAFSAALSEIAEPEGLRGEIEAAAEQIRDAARVNLDDGQPPETSSGALAASLTVDIAADGASATVGTPLDYGWRLEFGSLGRPAMPWLEPAFRDARAGILDRLRRWLAAPGKRSAG